MTKKVDYGNLITLFGILVLAGIFLYGGQQGWFRGITSIQAPGTLAPNNQPIINFNNLYSNCNDLCIANSFKESYAVPASGCTPGDSNLKYSNQQQLLLNCCCKTTTSPTPSPSTSSSTKYACCKNRFGDASCSISKCPLLSVQTGIYTSLKTCSLMCTSATSTPAPSPSPSPSASPSPSPSTPPNYHCVDTDNGKVYGLIGTASDDWHTNDMTDYCIGNSLYEYYCPSAEEKFSFDLHPCPIGCDNGICVNYCTAKRSSSEISSGNFRFGTSNDWLLDYGGGGTGFSDYTLQYNLGSNVLIQGISNQPSSIEDCIGKPYISTQVKLGSWNEGSKACLKNGNQYVMITTHDATSLNPWTLSVGYNYAECGE